MWNQNLNLKYTAGRMLAFLGIRILLAVIQLVT
jgi:class 3 adenylate cyclase